MVAGVVVCVLVLWLLLLVLCLAMVFVLFVASVVVGGVIHIVITASPAALAIVAAVLVSIFGVLASSRSGWTVVTSTSGRAVWAARWASVVCTPTPRTGRTTVVSTSGSRTLTSTRSVWTSVVSTVVVVIDRF